MPNPSFYLVMQTQLLYEVSSDFLLQRASLVSPCMGVFLLSQPMKGVRKYNYKKFSFYLAVIISLLLFSSNLSFSDVKLYIFISFHFSFHSEIERGSLSAFADSQGASHLKHIKLLILC